MPSALMPSTQLQGTLTGTGLHFGLGAQTDLQDYPQLEAYGIGPILNNQVLTAIFTMPPTKMHLFALLKAQPQTGLALQPRVPVSKPLPATRVAPHTSPSPDSAASPEPPTALAVSSKQPLPARAAALKPAAPARVAAPGPASGDPPSAATARRTAPIERAVARPWQRPSAVHTGHSDGAQSVRSAPVPSAGARGSASGKAAAPASGQRGPGAASAQLGGSVWESMEEDDYNRRNAPYPRTMEQLWRIRAQHRARGKGTGHYEAEAQLSSIRRQQEAGLGAKGAAQGQGHGVVAAQGYGVVAAQLRSIRSQQHSGAGPEWERKGQGQGQGQGEVAAQLSSIRRQQQEAGGGPGPQGQGKGQAMAQLSSVRSQQDDGVRFMARDEAEKERLKQLSSIKAQQEAAGGPEAVGEGQGQAVTQLSSIKAQQEAGDGPMNGGYGGEQEAAQLTSIAMQQNRGGGTGHGRYGRNWRATGWARGSTAWGREPEGRLAQLTSVWSQQKGHPVQLSSV